MSRDLLLPAIFTVMVIGMTLFPDRSEVFGSTDGASGEIAALDASSQG